jgi:large repetitive protein
VKLSGTAVAGTAVDVYDQDTLLGAVKAGSRGAWSFTTPQLANGDHTFTARATDAYTNSGQRSKVAPSVDDQPKSGIR